MTAWETTLKTLNAEGIGGPLTYRHSRTSSVTTSWGVDWDDEFIARDWNEQFAIYRATTPDGHVFHRRLRRGRIPDLPVVLVIEKQFERIEKKTRRDRDRNAFGDPRDPPAQARRVQCRGNRGPPGRTQAAPPVRVGAGVPFGPGLCDRLR